MKLDNIKNGSALLYIFIAAILLNSCKKTVDSNADENPADEKARIIETIKERYGNVTAPVIIPVNQPASSISYIDHNGIFKPIGGNISTDATCGQYTCATAPSPSDLYVSYTLPYIKWYYTCGTGNDLIATWSISVPYTVLLQDLNSSTYSFGNIRIKSGSTVLATSGNLGNGNLAIVNHGADPNCSSNTLYTVTYKWDDVSETYFPGNSVECSLNLYNNCSLVNNLNVVGWTSGPPSPNSMLDVFTHPCDRIDQAFILPAGPSQTYTIVAGSYVVCSPPSGFTGTTHNEVEYRPVTHLTSKLWNDQPISTSPIKSGIVTGSGTPGTPARTIASCCGLIDLRDMVDNSGEWLVRYRNRHTSGCSSLTLNVGDAWPEPWFVEYWNL